MVKPCWRWTVISVDCAEGKEVARYGHYWTRSGAIGGSLKLGRLAKVLQINPRYQLQIYPRIR